MTEAVHALSATAPPRAPAAAVAVVYLAGLFQGLVLVSFAALSAVLNTHYAFTDADYGSIFLPPLAFTVLGAVFGGTLARRLGLKRILLLSLAVNGVSQALLASLTLLPIAAAYLAVLGATGAMGLGFGLFGAPINNYPVIFYPNKAHAAVVAAHTVIGLGLAVGPLLAGAVAALGVWYMYPLGVLGGCVGLAFLAAATQLPTETADRTHEHIDCKSPLHTLLFWVFVSIVVLYAVGEATLANWIVLYLTEAKGLAEPVAASALSAFWTFMVAGRVIAMAVIARVQPAIVWAVMPFLMIVAFVLMPLATTPARAIGLFAFAGLACSAFFPLTVSMAAHRFPAHVAWVSSMLIAALMVGVGIGTFAVGNLRDMLAFESIYLLSVLYPLSLLILAFPILRREMAGR